MASYGIGIYTGKDLHPEVRSLFGLGETLQADLADDDYRLNRKRTA